MADAVGYKDGIGRKELLKIRRRFAAVHRERLRRIEGELLPFQRDLITLLPLLFHINHPTLPGFVGSNTPAGIPDFTPGKNLLRVARKLSRSFAYKKRAKRRYPIQALYLMGSTGSIAQTSGSDFDLWLCRDPKLTPGPLKALGAKAAKIEKWAQDFGLELHVFIIDAEAFRRGERDALSRESSGSTQVGLLLEEFYRTGVLLAGLYPLWWLVPPEEEANYSEFAGMLLHKRFVNPLDCIDFGGLEQLPIEEFFGAAHWQLFKGISSPYKTILKLLLIEAYAQDYPHIRWLCQESKAAIYAGNVDMTDLDPYVMMYRRVEHYLISRKEQKRLELARRCFYFKVDQPLTRNYTGKRERWQRLLLKDLTREWGWGVRELTVLDTRNRWPIDRVFEERNTLVQELTRSYRLLMDFARTYAGRSQISSEELRLLGRKLYTAMEKRPGKIDIVNPGISGDLVTERASLHVTLPSGGEPGWRLYMGDIDDDDLASETTPVKYTLGLVEMLAWCHFNQVLDRSSIMYLYPEDCPVHKNELKSILGVLRNLYPSMGQTDIPLHQLATPAHATACTLFVNTGVDPVSRLSSLGKQITSNRSDPLSFGAFHTSLVGKLEQLITTSWGETVVLIREGTSGLLDALCDYLRLVLLTNSEAPPPEVTAHSFSSVRSYGIARRVEMLFNNVCHSFGDEGKGLKSRYLLQADNIHYVIHQEQDGFVHDPLVLEENLFQLLGEPQREFRGLTIDPMALQESSLPTIYEINQPDIIQVFLHPYRGQTLLYVLDEQGTLFHQRLGAVNEQYLLLQLQRFIHGIRLTRSLLAGDPTHRLLLDAPEFYKLSRDHRGRFCPEPLTPPRRQLPDNYLEVRLIGESLDIDQTPYLLICGNREFGSMEYGRNLFKFAAEYILSQRKDHQSYPIYLTGLDLSGVPGGDPYSTAELFNLKYMLEELLNKEMTIQRTA